MNAMLNRGAGVDLSLHTVSGVQGHPPRPLRMVALAGLVLLGAAGVRAQTVSTRLEADVPRWMGRGPAEEDRGLLSGSFDGRGLRSSEGASSIVGGAALGSVPSMALETRDLEGSDRSRPQAGLFGRVVSDVVDWVDRKVAMDVAHFEDPVHAPASGSAGGGSPLFVEVGSHMLVRNQAGQWLTLTARNESASAVLLAGLNFNVQIADSGPVTEGGFGIMDGPNITRVDLVTGTPFSSNHSGTTAATGNVPQAGLWTVATLTGTISIGPGESVTLARIELDTSGFNGDESWSLSLTAGPAGGLQSTTSFVQIGSGGLVDAVDVRFNPGTIMVPEPGTVAGVVGFGLAVWCGVRRIRRAASLRGV